MRPDSHELYGRRRSRNVGLGLVLGAFVIMVFSVTIVKLAQGQMVGHMTPERSQMLPKSGS